MAYWKARNSETYAALPGINKKGNKSMPDGRAKSSPFQQNDGKKSNMSIKGNIMTNTKTGDTYDFKTGKTTKKKKGPGQKKSKPKSSPVQASTYRAPQGNQALIKGHAQTAKTTGGSVFSQILHKTSDNFKETKDMVKEKVVDAAISTVKPV